MNYLDKINHIISDNRSRAIPSRGSKQKTPKPKLWGVLVSSER